MLMYAVQVAGFFSESRAGFNSNFVINKQLQVAGEGPYETFVVSTNYTI